MLPLKKNKITSTIEHVYTARCSLFKSLTEVGKTSPWKRRSLVVLAIVEPVSVLDGAAPAYSCAASEPELACLGEVQAAGVRGWLHLNK